MTNLQNMKMSEIPIKNLKYRVVEYSEYKNKIIHIENISRDMAQMLSNMMNNEFDSYFVPEDMEDVTDHSWLREK